MMNTAESIILEDYTITDKEFGLFQKLIYDKAGISMAQSKKGLVQGRLAKRLRRLNLNNFHEYYELVHAETDGAEMQMLVDLLTTNETYFYREQKHFDFIVENIIKNHKPYQSFKIWSAACSSGEEPYSIAMQLASKLGLQAPWSIMATDLNQQILDTARRGMYPILAAEKIPNEYLREYCLKGTGRYSNYFLIDKQIKQKVDFQEINLNANWKNTDSYDLIVLRNVMIYFNKQTRQKLIERIAKRLKPKGYLFISHSETLTGVSDSFKCVQPAIYRLK